MNMLTLTWLKVVTFLCIEVCIASKLLLVMPAGTKSHKIFYYGIVEALTEEGHEITIVSPYKPSGPMTNVREVVLNGNFSNSLAVMNNPFDTKISDIIRDFIRNGPKGCVDTFFEEPVQEILKEDYDLVLLPLVFSDCYLPYIYEKKIPFIYIFPNALVGSFSEMVGQLELPSIVPNLLQDATFPMTFLQRGTASLLSVINSFMTFQLGNKYMDAELKSRGVTTSGTPPISELQTSASLAIINSVRTLESPQRPYSPNVIFAGGIHIKPKGQVEMDIQQWMDGARSDGFIFFSLGSNVKSSQIKKEHLKILMDVFQSLKQLVIWKWDLSEMENVPPNVKISKWLPQQDILAHPNIRLFITHGGLLSTQEATYFGVPVIGMPVYADQYNNIARAAAEGWGKKVDWKSLSKEEFQKAITECLENPRLRQIASHRSKLMKDLQMSPSDTVKYWVGYVIRQNGSHHLHTPIAHMPWHQIYNIDVWIALLLGTTAVTFLFLFLVKILFTYCCNKKRTKIKKQ